MNRISTISRSLIVASIAAGALTGLASFASAAPDRPPVSGDERATAYPGNVVAKDCPTLFPGSTAVKQGDIEFTGGDDTADVDITAVPDGIEVVGVIVKGGPAYNVYKAADLGEMPWLGLHAPLVPSGQPAAVSHWFVCGVKGTETTTTSPETSTTSPTDTPPGTSSESEQPGTSTDTSTSTDVSPAAEEGDLAATGFAAGPLVALGAGLLIGGSALLFLLRRRAAQR